MVQEIFPFFSSSFVSMLGTGVFYIVAFIAVITVIVFVHEFGHYYIARRCGVKIEVFSIGFGKELWGWTDKSGTRWKIAMIPAGGYVKMFGDMDPSSAPDKEKIASMSETEKNVAFHTKPLFQKSAIVAAGPLANFLFAIVVLFFFYSILGKPYISSEISEILPNSPAEKAGLLSKDIIQKIDGSKTESFEDISRILALTTEESVNVVVERNHQLLTFTLFPELVETKDIFGNTVKTRRIGIKSVVMSHRDLSMPAAAVAAVKEVYVVSEMTLKAIGQMIVGKRGTEEISGPIRIAKYAGMSAEQGAATLIWFMIVISINLGLVNLFPIPLLDGGHLLYYAIEAIQGKPLADKVQKIGLRLGTALIIALAIFAVVNDIRHF